MEKEFKAKVAKSIAAIYWAAFAGEFFIMIYIPFITPMPLEAKLVFYGVFSLVIAMFLFIIYRLYHMKFVINQGVLHINGVFKKNKINISEISKAEKSAIPFGMRLFGGSFIGGYYYLPGIGRAWVAMSNFTDGVLIKTRDDKNFLITPENPEEFVNLIKG